jgi:hypothetical protein
LLWNETIGPGVAGIIVGALATALLGGLGFFGKSVLERRRVLKRSLYLLLEFWQYLNNAMPVRLSSLITAYVAEFEDTLRHAGIKEPVPTEAKQMLIDRMLALINTMNSHRNTDFLGEYPQIVKELSYVAPFLAFKLGGKQDSLKLVADLDAYLNECIASNSASDLRSLPPSPAMSVSYQVQNEILDDLEKSILEIAGRIGPITKLKTMLFLYLDKNRVAVLMREYARPLLEQMVREAAQQTEHSA